MDHETLTFTITTKGGRIQISAGGIDGFGKTRLQAYAAWHTRYMGLSEPEQTTVWAGTAGGAGTAGTGSGGGRTGGAGAAA